LDFLAWFCQLARLDGGEPVARPEPSGLAFGEPKDRLRDSRGATPRISLSLNAGYGTSTDIASFFPLASFCQNRISRCVTHADPVGTRIPQHSTKRFREAYSAASRSCGDSAAVSSPAIA
jgi:hypothetical protein